MTARRLLLIHRAGSTRSALARALGHEGFEVRTSEVAEAKREFERFGPEIVVCEVDKSHPPDWIEGLRAKDKATGRESAPRFLSCSRPIDMEELRYALREG